MREASSQSRDQQRRKPGKSGRNKKRKNFNRGSGANGNVSSAQANGNVRNSQPQPPANGGVCQKCGHPAPDGKLCNFHRSLLNSIRNDFGKKSGRNYATI
ncbi:MAG: hypothetical protein R2748_08595 [Bryobacterales bacterium]